MEEVTDKGGLGLLIKCSKPNGKDDTGDYKEREGILTSILKSVIKPEGNMPNGPDNASNQAGGQKGKVLL